MKRSEQSVDDLFADVMSGACEGTPHDPKPAADLRPGKYRLEELGHRHDFCEVTLERLNADGTAACLVHVPAHDALIVVNAANLKPLKRGKEN